MCLVKFRKCHILAKIWRRRNHWKISFLKKLFKNSEKIQGRRSRYADSKNIACWWSRSNIFEKIGMKCEFLKISKDFDISTADSGKTVGGIKEPRPKVSSRARKLQETAFSLVSKISKFRQNLKKGGPLENFHF